MNNSVRHIPMLNAIVCSMTELTNFVILEGSKTTVKNGVINYVPEFAKVQREQGEEVKEPQSALIRSNIKFNKGILEFKFKAADKSTGILALWHHEQNEIMAIGLSRQTNSFRLVSHELGADIKSGNINQFKSNEEVYLRIEIDGTTTSLFINDVLMSELDYQPPLTPITLRVTSTGKVSLHDLKVETKRPKLFVVMQFTEEFNNLYSDVIVPAAQEIGFEVIRADEFHASTPILSDIVKSIRESSAIIADITPDNPNVFYEIGYAHAIRKPTILICDRSREKLPFDISSFRTLFYENSIAGKSKIEESLRKYLKNIAD